MPHSPPAPARPRRLCAWLAAATLVMCTPPSAALASAPSGGPIGCAGRAPFGGLQQPVAEALRAVGLLDSGSAGPTVADLARILEAHGMPTALDLNLLEVDGAETKELMRLLRRAGVSIGARSKVRLLIRCARRRSIRSCAKL
eukprot:SAG31_NODE_5751_length_2345_cov_1.588157_1_plen_143_part_00